MIGVATTLLIHLTAMQAPWLSTTLKLGPVESALLGPILIGALAFLGITEAYKLARRVGEARPAAPSRAARL